MGYDAFRAQGPLMSQATRKVYCSKMIKTTFLSRDITKILIKRKYCTKDDYDNFLINTNY